MKIDSLSVGPIGTNCYILQDEQAKVCAVIDPGDEPERIIKAVERTGCAPAMILLTHGHFDHYTAVEGLLEKWPELPVYINEKDVTDRHTSGFALLFPRLPEKNQRYYKEDDVLSLGSLAIRVMETAGHSRGSVCLLVGDTIFSGDTLFCGSCGRNRLIFLLRRRIVHRPLLREKGQQALLHGIAGVVPFQDQLHSLSPCFI